MKHNCMVILGATASGKTKLACALAYNIGGEIISADSRQVYKYLNIGTGKDLSEYEINGEKIPYHLMDIVEPQEQYYLHQFINDLRASFLDISSRNKMPIICGGTGLYLDALHKDFSLTDVKENIELRNKLALLSKDELIDKIKAYPEELWNSVDIHSKKRLIRGIEIADYKIKNQVSTSITEHARVNNLYRPIYFGILQSIEERKEKINDRLKSRLNEGLIEEVEALLKMGIKHDRLQRFGLEYKFVSKYILKELSKDELFTKLQTAIHQFAKRQMTWFRKMEKENVEIHWLNSSDSIDVNVIKIKSLLD